MLELAGWIPLVTNCWESLQVSAPAFTAALVPLYTEAFGGAYIRVSSEVLGADFVLAWSRDPAQLMALRTHCQRAFAERYSNAAQLAPRIAILQQHALVGG